jgi:DNA-binding CsgD family transcriptional regulator
VATSRLSRLSSETERLFEGDAAGAAAHLAQGARRGDRKALAGLDRAAQELRSSSPELAAGLALRSLELTAADDTGRFARSATAVDALIAAHLLDTATELATLALASGGWSAIRDAQLRLTLSSLLLMTGRPGDSEAQANIVQRETRLPNELRATADRFVLMSVMAQNEFDRAREPAEVILAGAERPRDDLTLASAVMALGYIAWDEGRVADALGLLRAAVRRSDQAPQSPRVLYPRLGLQSMLCSIGEFDQAHAVIAAARGEIDLADDKLWSPAAPLNSARLRLATGHLDDAVAQANVGLARAEQLGTWAFVAIAGWAIASVALLRGDLTEVEALIEKYRPAASSRLGAIGVIGAASYAWLEARLATARGDPAGALQLMDAVYEDVPFHRRLLIQEPAAAAWLVRTALMVRDGDRAEAIVTAVELLAAENRGFTVVAAAADQARGLVDRDARALDRAIARHRHPFAVASAAEDAGEVRAECGDEDGARARLEKALSIYRQAGADGEADRVRATMRDLRMKPVRTCRTAGPASAWDTLTDSERLVTHFVAEGLTNRQVAKRLFLSRHTVDFHLRQVFRKLGITSRVDLVAVALEQGDS